MLVSHEFLVDSFCLQDLHGGVIFLHGLSLQWLSWQQTDHTLSNVELKLLVKVKYVSTSIYVVAPVLCTIRIGRHYLLVTRTLPSQYLFDMTPHYLHPMLDLPPIQVGSPLRAAAPLLLPLLPRPPLAAVGRRIFKVGLVQPPLDVIMVSLVRDELCAQLGGREAAHQMEVFLEGTRT